MTTSIISEVFDNSKVKLLGDISRAFNQRLADLSLTKNQVCNALDMDKKTLDPILDGSAKQVDIFSLIKIGEFLGLPSIVDAVQLLVDSSPGKVEELIKIKKANYIISHFDLDLLKKAQFFTGSINDFQAIEERLMKFFGLESIYDYSKKFGIAFKKSSRSRNDKMLEMWAGCAHYQFEMINNPNPYNAEKFKDLVTRIKPFSRDAKHGMLKVCRALYQVGVTVIVQPHLTTTQVHGATFIINGKPCIVLTDLNKRYSTLWFALMHEIFHCLFDFEAIEAVTYHISGAPELLLEREAKADLFARNYFLTEEKLMYIRPFIKNPTMVSQYAEKYGIHESMIYDFHCWNVQAQGKSEWGFYQKYLPSIADTLKLININPLTYERIEDSIITVKNNLESKINQFV